MTVPRERKAKAPPPPPVRRAQAQAAAPCRAPGLPANQCGHRDVRFGAGAIVTGRRDGPAAACYRRRARQPEDGARHRAGGPPRSNTRRTWLSRAVLVMHLGRAGCSDPADAQHRVRGRGAVPVRGHMEIAHWLHGAALQGDYASYFSGAPVLYPVLGALRRRRRRAGRRPGGQPPRDAGHHRPAVLADPAAVQRAGRPVRGRDLLGDRVRPLPRATSPPTTPLPVPARRWRPGSWSAPRGCAGPSTCWRRRPAALAVGTKYAGCCSCPPSPSCPRWRAGRSGRRALLTARCVAAAAVACSRGAAAGRPPTSPVGFTTTARAAGTAPPHSCSGTA